MLCSYFMSKVDSHLNWFISLWDFSSTLLSLLIQQLRLCMWVSAGSVKPWELYPDPTPWVWPVMLLQAADPTWVLTLALGATRVVGRRVI